MQSIKTGGLALILVAIALTGGFLTACSSVSSNSSQAPNTTAPNADGIHGMEHGNGMNDSMAMDNGPADDYYDLRFIDAMRLHHRGAIAMAQEAQQKSQRPEIKKLAGNIIEAQNREENELLRNWRQEWYPKAGSEFVTYGGEGKPVVPMSEQQQQSMTMKMDLGPANAEFDLRFMNAMIAHHEGAIAMAQDALQKSQRPEIKQLAQEIASSQQAEIEQMKQWRKAWYQESEHSM